MDWPGRRRGKRTEEVRKSKGATMRKEKGYLGERRGKGNELEGRGIFTESGIYS
jgi:hypothetical protein